jgi:hypothetical protein
VLLIPDRAYSISARRALSLTPGDAVRAIFVEDYFKLWHNQKWFLRGCAMYSAKMLLALFLVLFLAQSGAAFAQFDGACGAAPLVEDRKIEGDIEGKANFLKKFIGDAGLTGKIEVAQNDVLQHYPNADKLRLKQYFLYVVCMQIMADTTHDAITKIKAFTDASQVVFPPQRPANPPATMTMLTTIKICSGLHNACPKGAIWVGCGHLLEGIKKATDKCSAFTTTVLEQRTGGKCGYEFLSIDCSVSVPIPTKN